MMETADVHKQKNSLPSEILSCGCLFHKHKTNNDVHIQPFYMRCKMGLHNTKIGRGKCKYSSFTPQYLTIELLGMLGSLPHRPTLM